MLVTIERRAELGATKTNNFQTVTHLVSVSVLNVPWFGPIRGRVCDSLANENPWNWACLVWPDTDRKFETENNPPDFESHEGRELVTIER